MNLFLRMLAVITTAVFSRSKLTLLDESVVMLRVLPNDLDINGHMTNGRYLTVMDLGRVDLILRTGLAKVVWQEGWQPLVGSAITQFKRSLKPFESYQLKTKTLCWDDKWIFLEHTFERNGKIVARSIVKTLFRHPRTGNVAPGKILKMMGITADSPQMPLSVQLWQDAEMLLDPVATGIGPGGRRLALCATPNCENEILDPRETGNHCSTCALEQHLFDRQDRWDEFATFAK